MLANVIQKLFSSQIFPSKLFQMIIHLQSSKKYSKPMYFNQKEYLGSFNIVWAVWSVECYMYTINPKVLNYLSVYRFIFGGFSAAIDFPDWCNNTAAMFPFLHAISHFHLPTLSHLSLPATANHLTVCWKHFNTYLSFLCVAACSKPRQRRPQQRPEPFCQQPPGDQWWDLCYVGNQGMGGSGLCGMRISLEDQCTINNFTDNTPLPFAPRAGINTPN